MCVTFCTFQLPFWDLNLNFFHHWKGLWTLHFLGHDNFRTFCKSWQISNTVSPFFWHHYWSSQIGGLLLPPSHTIPSFLIISILCLSSFTALMNLLSSSPSASLVQQINLYFLIWVWDLHSLYSAAGLPCDVSFCGEASNCVSSEIQEDFGRAHSGLDDANGNIVLEASMYHMTDGSPACMRFENVYTYRRYFYYHCHYYW